MRLKKDEVYVGTPENPTLSTDALDTVVTTSLDRLEDHSSSVEEKVTGKDTT